MSEEAKEEGGAPAKGRNGVVIVAAIVALLGGGAAGVFALGPMLGGGGHAESEEGGHGEAEEEGGHGKKSGGHGASAGSPVFAIENLVVNPAGTQGTRFLIATVAIEAADAETATELHARDPEIRDVLLGLLSKRTVDQLSDLDGRENLKEEIRVAIEGVVGAKRIVRVFIPQYVLQ
jgi:flagellar protein FliL